MIRILIADDFALLREDICDTLNAQEDMEVVGTAESGAQAEKLAAETDYDIILMDIEMKFMDGMMAAEEIRKVDTEVIIIFITNSPQYAIKGYAVDALDFLQINAHGTAHKLDTSAIYWIENCGHDLVFHTAEGELTAPGSMTETEEKLAQDSYFRVNKGCLVNLEHVDRMDGEDAIVHGDRVPLARARRKAFLDALNDYINGAG